MGLSPVVRVGDQSDHGGSMITANGKYKDENKQAGVNGDLHSCPLPGHGVTSVSASSVNTSSGGPKILRIGDVAGCGARIATGSSITKSS